METLLPNQGRARDCPRTQRQLEIRCRPLYVFQGALELLGRAKEDGSVDAVYDDAVG
jgi:hypothetical protein